MTQLSYFQHPWYFNGNMPISANSQVEIRGLRYDYLGRAFEAREIYVPETAITFRITDGYRFFQLPWTQVRFFAFIHQLVIESGITRFALYPVNVSAAED